MTNSSMRKFMKAVRRVWRTHRKIKASLHGVAEEMK